jgi:hypothetical protein
MPRGLRSSDPRKNSPLNNTRPTTTYLDLATLLSETPFIFYENMCISAGVAKPVKLAASTEGGGLKIHSRNGRRYDNMAFRHEKEFGGSNAPFHWELKVPPPAPFH